MGKGRFDIWSGTVLSWWSQRIIARKERKRPIKRENHGWCIKSDSSKSLKELGRYECLATSTRLGDADDVSHKLLVNYLQ